MYTQIYAKVVLNIRWAHISLYSFSHVRHHILVQAKFKECSVKLQILASHATIGVSVSFLLSGIFFFEKKMVLNFGYIQGVPKGMNRF